MRHLFRHAVLAAVVMTGVLFGLGGSAQPSGSTTCIDPLPCLPI